MNNVTFREMKSLLQGFGFELKEIHGSHHTFRHPWVHVKMNLQNQHGEAKPYQIRQFLKLIEKYDLILNGEEDE